MWIILVVNFQVYFVDYGNVQETRPNHVKNISSELMDTPGMAVHCQLHGVSFVALL